MSHIAIDINRQQLVATVDHPLVAGSIGQATFSVATDASWDGYAITIVFATAYTQKSCLYTGGMMDVPWEVLDRPGYLWISAVGHAPGKRRPTAIMQQPLVIVANGKIEGGPPQEYSPALWEQVMARLDDVGTGGGGSSAGAHEAAAKAEEAQKKAEAAQAAAETAAQAAEASNQAAAQEASKAAGEASNAAQSAGAAADAQSAAQAAQGKAEEARQAAGAAKEGAENAKNAAVAALESIPVPKPTGADDGKMLVARGAGYQLEEIAAGGGDNSELEYIGEYTLAEDVATWEIESDLDGAPLQLKKMYFEVDIKPAQVNIDNNISNTNVRMSIPTWANAYGVNVCVSSYLSLRKTEYKENPGWGQLWEIQTLNGRDVVFRRSKGPSNSSTVTAGEAAGPGYITGLGLCSADPNKAQFGTGSTVKIWGVKV